MLVAVLRAGAQPAQPARRGRRRGALVGAVVRTAGRLEVSVLRRCAASARTLRRRGGADRRLLQRQPDVDAGRDRRSWPRARPAGGAWRVLGDACSSSVLSTAPRLHREIGAHAQPSAASTLLVTVGPARGAEMAALSYGGETHMRWPDARGRRRRGCSAGMLAARRHGAREGASRGVGLERVAAALEGAIA